MEINVSLKIKRIKSLELSGKMQGLEFDLFSEIYHHKHFWMN